MSQVVDMDKIYKLSSLNWDWESFHSTKAGIIIQDDHIDIADGILKWW